MISLIFSTLLSDLSLLRASLPSDPDVDLVTPDPLLCRRSAVYLAVTGFRRNGHDVLPLAVSRGAVAFVIEDGHPSTEEYLIKNALPYAVCSNAREAEAFLISMLLGHPSRKLSVTAVTGTNGKTTVTSMLAAIYRLAGKKCRTIGTLSGSLTTPDPPELYPLLAEYEKEGVEHVFMEASSHALALSKLAPIVFDNALFTNLTPEHLDFHKSMRAYAEAKAKLFTKAKRSVILLDSPYARDMINASKGEVFTCSVKDPDADFVARNEKRNGRFGISYDVATRDRVFRVGCPVPGDFTVANTLLAASTAYLDGIPPHVIRAALDGFAGVKGRLERVGLPTNDFSVYIDYAHTPDALETILKTVRGFLNPAQRLVLLFGCGGDRDKSKRPIMGEIASRLADFVILTADNSRSEKTEDILNDILSGFDETTSHTVFLSRKEAIEYAVTTAMTGDVILLCGKGHEEYEITSEGKRPFSEREIVLAATEKHLRSKGLY